MKIVEGVDRVESIEAITMDSAVNEVPVDARIPDAAEGS